jgi:transcription elongation GreA/GreB family factor
MQNKEKLIAQLILALQDNYQTALSAAKKAHSTATDKANIAENKYDTLGLEAAYLAEGHANRSIQCKADLNTVKNLSLTEYDNDDAISLGAYVKLVDQHQTSLYLFLAPVSGGVKFVYNEKTIIVITQSSPLGKLLFGKYVDDEITLGTGNHQKVYCICEIA